MFAQFITMNQRKLLLSMQVTLDGYVAGPNDEMDFIDGSEDEWADLAKDLEKTDTFLLGRKMYEIYSPFWQAVLRHPGSKKEDLQYAQLADKTRHIVFTSNKEFKPDWNNTTVLHDIREIATLKQQPGKNIIAWGGGIFAGNLIDLGLVDEIRLGLNPTILGQGKSLFKHLHQRRKLKLENSTELKSGLLILRYTLQQ